MINLLEVVAYVLEKDVYKKREMKQKLIEETIDHYFSKFEQHLKEHGGFFIGKVLIFFTALFFFIIIIRLNGHSHFIIGTPPLAKVNNGYARAYNLL